ncbi:MAG: hypothetical protein HRT35_14685 [Algicola sp.]|nr:hypothetical protein [Algicola sp.]
METNYNPEGKWSVDSVKAKYWALSLSLGGVFGFEPEPKRYTNKNGATWVYNIMDSVIDGVKLGDSACVQISIEYIQDNVMHSTTGYIRASMARSLRNAELTKKQKVTLAGIFLKQLESGLIYREFKEYCRLFKRIGVEPYRQEIEKYNKSHKQYIRHAASRLLA